jgi:hypothetical protein
MENLDAAMYTNAKRKVRNIKGFYANLTSYITVIITLLIINLVTSPEYLWFLWPALGWGIPLALHGVTVFNLTPFLGEGWEQRKIHEFIEKERNTKYHQSQNQK